MANAGVNTRSLHNARYRGSISWLWDPPRGLVTKPRPLKQGLIQRLISVVAGHVIKLPKQCTCASAVHYQTDVSLVNSLVTLLTDHVRSDGNLLIYWDLPSVEVIRYGPRVTFIWQRRLWLVVSRPCQDNKQSICVVLATCYDPWPTCVSVPWSMHTAV